MVVLFHHHLQLRLPRLDQSSPITRRSSTKKLLIRMSSTSSLDFPYLSAPQRSLMTSLLSTVETHLDPLLLPSSLPPDVKRFQNPTGASEGALHIRSGQPNCPVDLLLCSWIHCQIPTGVSLDIATVFAFLGPATDAPHLLVELIQSSPTSLILLMDLLPRKDMVLHPDYLKAFYEDTVLEQQRQKLMGLPETSLFFSSNLYIRGVLSPTAISVTITSGEGGRSLEEIVSDVVDQVAKEAVRIWLDAIGKDRGGGGGELGVRDGMIKRKAVEIDLAANLPRLFGDDVAGPIVEAIQKAFGV